MRRRGSLALIVLIAILLLVARTPKVYSESYTLSPLEDTYTVYLNPDTNYGSEAVLNIMTGTSPTEFEYTYVKFNLSGFEQIVSATLRMYASTIDDSSATYDIKEIEGHNQTWTEDTLTHNDRPTITGDEIWSGSAGSTGWKEYDVTTYALEMFDGGYANISFGFLPSAGEDDYTVFHSKEGVNDPQLIIEGYISGNSVEYNLYGSIHEETGTQDSSIECTLTRVGEAPRVITVDGWENITEPSSQVVWKFDLGNNVSRTYYLLPDVNETIYVIRPQEPYYTYSFSMIDFVGVENAYLETLFNVGGTDWVVERWNATLEGELPFTLSWGNAYQLRLVCNRGTYYYAPIVASSSQNIILEITGDMFPVDATSILSVSASGTRVNSTHIQGVYADTLEETTWINMSIYEPGDSTVISSVNVTDDSLTWNWYDADATMNYYLRILAQHERRGTLEWVYIMSTEYTPDNPWSDLDTLFGDFVVPPSQLFGLGILGIFIGAFSWKNSPVGLVVINIIAMILQYYNWVNFGWTWLAVSFSISILISLSLLQERSR